MLLLVSWYAQAIGLPIGQTLSFLEKQLVVQVTMRAHHRVRLYGTSREKTWCISIAAWVNSQMCALIKTGNGLFPPECFARHQSGNHQYYIQ